ncbi:MAG TPA: GNAT family protein [Caulobacteraceae bacterium]|jgi:RimJ/RimL family protein N-acetyltransferase
MTESNLELRPILMAGRVRLEPIAPEHRDDLAAAADRAEIWEHMPSNAAGAGFDTWFDAALSMAASGREAVWAVRCLSRGTLVGSTRYLAIVPEHRRLEIGHTWYAPDCWGSRVNPACKFALLRYAFETLGFNRVELKTDIANTRSQAAIAKLGAVREGVFRAHMVRRDGTLRDSVYFAITRDDWPAVRQRLQARLAPMPMATA